MTYTFKYKRFPIQFWRRIKKVVGHNLELEQNRMIVYKEDGSIIGIGNWSKMSMKLGVDWVLFTKDQMERESGQSVKLDPKVGK